MTPWPAAPEPIEPSNRATVERLGGVPVSGLAPTDPDSLAKAGRASRSTSGWGPERRAMVGRVTQVARYGKASARSGLGEELAELLLAAAAELESDPGCQLYLINRQTDAPDVIWVTELWRSQADLDASLERIRGSEAVAAAMALVEDWEMVDLDLLGGKGP